uniref:Uncharacterized protein n=1 Tax=Glossina palpalis gambiensis TaxID=67801 RepID=A0A1B0BWA1_9MUSC
MSQQDFINDDSTANFNFSVLPNYSAAHLTVLVTIQRKLVVIQATKIQNHDSPHHNSKVSYSALIISAAAIITTSCIEYFSTHSFNVYARYSRTTDRTLCSTTLKRNGYNLNNLYDSCGSQMFNCWVALFCETLKADRRPTKMVLLDINTIFIHFEWTLSFEKRMRPCDDRIVKFLKAKELNGGGHFDTVFVGFCYVFRSGTGRGGKNVMQRYKPNILKN